MWQALRERLHPKGVEIVTVALDTGGAQAARPWIEAANPRHPALIDVAHLCDELLGFVNVPSSVWIDETGTIVRPAEPAWPGSTPVIDALPSFEADLPPERKGVIDEIRRMNINPEQSLTMLMEWAENGSASRYVLTADALIARSHPRGDNESRAAAHFELGQHLHLRGHIDDAVGHWRAAHELYPSNWTYKRQAWNLETVDSVDQVSQYDGNWLADVQEIGAENYYPPLVP